MLLHKLQDHSGCGVSEHTLLVWRMHLAVVRVFLRMWSYRARIPVLYSPTPELRLKQNRYDLHTCRASSQSHPDVFCILTQVVDDVFWEGMRVRVKRNRACSNQMD